MTQTVTVGSDATSLGDLLRSRVFSHRAGPIHRTFTETLVDSRNRSSQLLRQEFPNSCRGSHWDDASVGRGIGHTARCATVWVTSLSFRRLGMIGAKHLISEAERIRAPRRRRGRDRTGSDDLLVELVIEARESLVGGAGEAETAIALAVGDRRGVATALVGLPGAGVDRLGAALHDVSRKAERTHHEAVGLALGIHIADVLRHGAGRKVELETDAVTVQDVALTVGDTIVNKAGGGGAQRISLVLANHEGLGIKDRVVVKGEGRHRGEQLDGYHCRDSHDKATGDAHVVIIFLSRGTTRPGNPGAGGTTSTASYRPGASIIKAVLRWIPSSWPLA